MRERTDGGPVDPEKPPPPDRLLYPVADAHCHLDLMEGTIDEAIEQAAAVGVTRLVTIGIDAASSEWAADVANRHPTIFAAAGIHPNEAPTASDGDLHEIERIAHRPEVRAIGETGLDYFRTDEPGHAMQQESFRAHIQIAKATGKALVIHDREAHDDVLRILAEEGAPDRTVFHCFSGDAEMAKVCADRGYVMSFAGNLTFKNATTLREALLVAPREQLLVETDAPFLAPTPHRGRANAPYLIPVTLAAMAEIRGESVENLCQAVDATFTRIFDPSPP